MSESCIGARGSHHTQRHCYLQTCKPKNKISYTRMLPPHIITALQKWALVIEEKWHSPLTMTPRSPNTGVNTQEIRPSGQTATPSPPISLVTLFAIPITMKTPCIQQQGMRFTLLPLAQRWRLPSCSFPPEIKGQPPALHIAPLQIPAHMQILGLHIIRPDPKCRRTLLEQYTDPYPSALCMKRLLALIK